MLLFHGQCIHFTRGGGGAPPLLKVIGTCRWTGYDFAGHQYWHRVSNRPNVVITIETGYQNRPSWLWRTTSFITGYRMPIVFYDRPAIQAEAMTFFFFFFFFLLVSSASPIRQGTSEEYNIATGYAFECFSKVYCDRVYFSCAERIMTGSGFDPPSGTPPGTFYRWAYAGCLTGVKTRGGSRTFIVKQCF